MEINLKKLPTDELQRMRTQIQFELDRRRQSTLRRMEPLDDDEYKLLIEENTVVSAVKAYRERTKTGLADTVMLCRAVRDEHNRYRNSIHG